MRTLDFRVVNNRLQFKCPFCGAKRSFGVAKGMRRRSVRCHKCAETTHCRLNRRGSPRGSQTGKCLLTTSQGREIEINLHDISMNGVGFDLPINALKALAVHHEIRFKCSWNQRLMGSNRYIVRSIKGRRVGAERLKSPG